MGRKPYRKKIEVNIEPADTTPEYVLDEAFAYPIYAVKVMHPSLRRREAPSSDAAVLGLITDCGVYDVYEENSGWARLKDNSWIMLQFCKKLMK